MNKVEHVANEVVRGLKERSGIDLEPENALIMARIAISVLGRYTKGRSALLLPDGRSSKASTKLGEKNGSMGPATCPKSRIWPASLCRTTSVQPFVRTTETS